MTQSGQMRAISALAAAAVRLLARLAAQTGRRSGHGLHRASAPLPAPAAAAPAQARAGADVAALAAVRDAGGRQRSHAGARLRAGALLPGRRQRRVRQAGRSRGRSAPAADLRQQALVFDWCQDLLTDAQRRDLTARLRQGHRRIAAGRQRCRRCARGRWPRSPSSTMCRRLRSANSSASCTSWWERKIVPGAARRARAWSRATMPMRCSNCSTPSATTPISICASPCRSFFKDFPIEHLMSYYPAIYRGAGQRIPHRRRAQDRRARPAARGPLARRRTRDGRARRQRAESQVLQGWLMHDQFMLRGTFGAPYEFLWANPYQPGLSYYHVPLVYHNPDFGKLFVRSSWDDSRDVVRLLRRRRCSCFEDGKVKPLDPQLGAPPLSLEEAVICFAKTGSKFRVKLGEDEDAVFILGLEPRSALRGRDRRRRDVRSCRGPRRHPGTGCAQGERHRNPVPAGRDGVER